MVEAKKLSAYWWWFDSQNNGIMKTSPWLQATLADLDEKTESMLTLIEQEADSFAKRAEMYYKKRPELIKLIEDLYRTHRALALHYDQATKFDFDPNTRLLTRTQTSHQTTCLSKSYDSYSDSIDLYHDQDSNEESNESEIDDHQIRDEESSSDELMKLREEIDRLKEENRIQKEMLVEKDEEKREVIRQMSLCVDSMKQENLILKTRYVSKMKVNNSSIFSRVFWEKMLF